MGREDARRGVAGRLQEGGGLMETMLLLQTISHLIIAGALVALAFKSRP